MIMVDGNNEYPNNKYIWDKCSAPIISNILELKPYLDSLNIVGRYIKDVKTVGSIYPTDFYIYDMDTFWGSAIHWLQREKTEGLKAPDNKLNVYREINTDDPLMLLLDDNSVVMISGTVGNAIRLAKNVIPWDIKQKSKIDAEFIFSNIIGKRIIGFSLETFDEPDEFIRNDCMAEVENIGWYISELKIRLTDGLNIVASRNIDYDTFYIQDSTGETLLISPDELREKISPMIDETQVIDEIKDVVIAQLTYEKGPTSYKQLAEIIELSEERTKEIVEEMIKNGLNVDRELK